MAAIMKFLCFVFLCSLFVGGNAQPCTVENLKISQTPDSGDSSVWNVTINNDCICSQSSVKLSCDGFVTNQPIDPSILSINGGECIVNDGRPIYGFKDFSFAYSSSAEFSNFTIISSQVACS